MVSWEVIHKASIFIAEEMGVALKRSALSPNIRERIDLSCVVADSHGDIVAQAEHIPVHLGSFRIGLYQTLNYLKNNDIVMNDGDIIVLNDPYIAGTHLNDIMVLAPVYWNGEVVAYVANKAHHVDVGGPVPGSINPEAKTLYEEGLVIPPVKLAEKWSIRRDVVNFIVSNVKTPEITIGDLLAQYAAVKIGIHRVQELFNRYGFKNVNEAWRRAVEYSRTKTLKALETYSFSSSEAEDYIELNDNDLVIRARVEISSKGVRIDYTGSSNQVSSPLNAVFGVTYAASVFSIMLFLGGDIPVNEGFYSLIEVSAPEESILNPRKPAPVSGGNLETSQRIVDTVLKAFSKIDPLKTPAAGSGTMMNIMIGGFSEKTGYWAFYETVGGGSGGRYGKHGVSGVHVNMTNTLNTPIEVAERNYPIMYTVYRIREGSGGDGLYRGGEGLMRGFIVREKAVLSILADRFRHKPYGLLGGEPGAPARVVIRRGGRELVMPSKFVIQIEAGDEVLIETPGGGGWGLKSNFKSSG
ncbi:MAG: hydantoinase B/oxoprolinase family protein [Desulfurococcaceae archaeon]